jgi:hypothetical protein
MHQKPPEFYKWIVQQSPDGLGKELFKVPVALRIQDSGVFLFLRVKRY